MLKIGDIIKVVKPTSDGECLREYIKIGTICKIMEIRYESDGEPYYGLLPLNSIRDIRWFYLEDELEKCNFESVNKHAEIKNVKNLPFGTKIKIVFSSGYGYPAVVFGNKVGFENGWHMCLKDIKEAKIYLA